MKILDSFVLKSFIRPFFITFIVMVLFLLMQFVWVYIDDLVGRGVEWYYITELLFYISATVVPRALPLSILLSSIMTFGGLGENNEMAAMKSSGLSLLRVMRPLMLFVILICVGAFFFFNNIIPIANLKSETLLRNITNKKPALNIRQGVFYNEIEGFSIKIGEKYGPDKSLLRNVLIYDHTAKQGNIKVIKSERGKMEVSDDDLFLNITLYDGNSYEEQIPDQAKERDNYPLASTSFEKSLIRFNLSEFQGGDMRQGGRKDFDMLDIVQLNHAVDSLEGAFVNRKEEFENQMTDKYFFNNADSVLKPIKMENNILDNVKEDERYRILQNASRIARSNKTYFSNTGLEYEWRAKYIARHLLEWEKKFSISFSCLVLFFIGAPLGAIIRKGGMGMPVVVSVIIYIIYHVISYSFEKLGRQLIWTPFAATWVANFILLPFGIFLTYKSATDSALFNVELYLKPFQKISAIFARIFKRS